MSNKIIEKNRVHIFFFILCLNYLFPLFVFGEITLFYHDALDSEIVYNHIIGKYLRGDSPSIELLLNGQISPEYLRRLFYPITYLYLFFNTETAYWVTDIFVKLISYISFYILSKKINNDKVACALLAALYASINYRTQDGLGMAIFPYLIYLIAFKKKFTLKNYILIVAGSLNSDFATCAPQVPFIFLISFILSKHKKTILKKGFLVLSIFIIGSAVANNNLIFGFLSDIKTHRNDFYYLGVDISQNLISRLEALIQFPTSLSWMLVRDFSKFLIFSSTLILSLNIILKKKNLELFQLISLILIINIFIFILNTKLISDIRNISPNIIKSFHFEYFSLVVPLIYLITINFIFTEYQNIKKYLFIFFGLCLIYFQINSSIIPFIKKNIVYGKTYRNIYTFNGYYMFQDYKNIKKVVGENKVISIGYDPMIAVINDIYAIDGYHNIYPLEYKIQFRKVIENELLKNPVTEKYYDNWGSRVYAFIDNPNDIKINFQEAKKIGASFVISKYKILNENLEEIKKINLKNKIFVYQIN